MKLNRKWLLAIALVLSLTMAIGGTLAYLTDRATVENVFTMGNVDIEVEEDFEQNSPLYPGVEVDKEAYIKNLHATESAWVWMVVSVPEELDDYIDLIWLEGYAGQKVNDLAHDGYVSYVVKHPYRLLPGTSTPKFLQGVELDESVDFQDGKYVAVINGVEKEIELPEELKIIVDGYAIQTEGFNDVDTAYTTYITQWGGLTGGESGVSSSWDGTSDTSWYNDTATEFLITTPQQLAGLADLVDGGNTFAGKTLKLGNDIDLFAEDENGNRISFDPIGHGYDTVFKGTFDGQDNTIENLYQNGWDLGLSYSTEGGGLFASVVDATIKNLTINKAEVVMECIDMGVLVGYSYGTCTYSDILVTNSTIANYQRYTGGVVGEVNGNQTFKNVDVKDTVISSLWGDFDCSLGGIIGGKYGEAEVIMEDCDVACELNAYNDVTSSYQWYAYRRAGMLIGNSEETVTIDGRTSASASYLNATNCTVTYGNWAKYTYCEFAGTSWPYVRVQEGYSCDAYSNPRYGVATDANGNKVVDDNHQHNEGEDHNILLTFDQLYGGGQGVYGTPTHSGVAVNYAY